jgi:protein gp37
MGVESKIQWTDATWNIAVGCTKVDEDCKYCYMYRDSLNNKRFDPKVVRKTTSVFKLPLRIKEPSKIFTSSYTDVFHPDIDSFRDEMWEIIRKCPQHTFQVLTKRPERIDQQTPVFLDGNYPKNVWMGTSVGSQNGIGRAIELLYSDWEGIKFLSLEPLWESIDLDEIPYDLIDNLSWVIIGGESGNDIGKYRYRPCKLEWIESLVEQCQSHSIPVFVKQLGTHLAKELKLTDRHGGNIAEWPKHLQVRQFPV